MNNFTSYNLTPCISPALAPNYVYNSLLSQLLRVSPFSQSPRNNLGTSMLSLYEPYLPSWPHNSPRNIEIGAYHPLLPSTDMASILSNSYLVPKQVQSFQKQEQSFPELQNLPSKPNYLKHEILEQAIKAIKKPDKAEESHMKLQEMPPKKTEEWKPTSKKRNRRKAYEVVRSFKCEVPGCSKAYGYLLQLIFSFVLFDNCRRESSLQIHVKLKHSANF